MEVLNMTEKYSKEQVAYQNAKVAYDAACAEYNQQAANLRWSERRPIRERLGIDAIEQVVQEAEANLIEWAKSKVSHLPDWAEVAPLFESQDPAIRAKLAVMTMKLIA